MYSFPDAEHVLRGGFHRSARCLKMEFVFAPEILARKFLRRLGSFLRFFSRRNIILAISALRALGAFVSGTAIEVGYVLLVGVSIELVTSARDKRIFSWYQQSLEIEIYAFLGGQSRIRVQYTWRHLLSSCIPKRFVVRNRVPAHPGEQLTSKWSRTLLEENVKSIYRKFRNKNCKFNLLLGCRRLFPPDKRVMLGCSRSISS